MAEEEEHSNIGGQDQLLQQPSKTSRLDRNNLKWDSIKEDIRRLYMMEDNTLPSTMNIIEREQGFTACERKWKSKLKEWGFDKNVPAEVMQVLVVKAQKRKREEGKETVFIRGDTEISAERMEHFKRRKTTHVVEALSPSVETPLNISYHTPRTSLDEETVDQRPTRLDTCLVGRELSDALGQNGPPQTVDETNIALEAEILRQQSQISTENIPAASGPNAASSEREHGPPDEVNAGISDGTEARGVEETAPAEGTDDNSRTQCVAHRPEAADENAPSSSSPGNPALSNVEFLLLSKICTLINAELKKSKPVDTQKGPKTTGISRLHNNRVLDAVFNAITTLGPIFPKGPRDYSVYTKTMDKMARIFEERGHTLGTMIALSLLKRAFGKRHSHITMACKCTCTYKLALIFDKLGEDALAESHYWSAFEGFQALEEEDRHISQKRQNYQLRCELSFARFLQRVGNNDEALNVLVSAFIKSLSRSCEAPATRTQLERILSSLEDISRNMDSDGHLAMNLAELRKHVFNRPLYKVAYFDLIKLANAFSFLGRFDDADLIFDFAFPKIVRMENWSLKKAQMAVYYAEHYQRHNEWAQSLKPLQSAFESLSLLFEKLALRRETTYIKSKKSKILQTTEKLVTSLEKLLKSVRSRLKTNQDRSIHQQLADTNTAREKYLSCRSYEDAQQIEGSLERRVKELEKAEEDRRKRQAHLEKLDLLHKTIGGWVRTREDDYSTNRSISTEATNKYGVTYSARSITGLSEGVSMGSQLIESV